MKILHIVGNRPQFVKLAVLDNALNKKAETRILHTGQHFDQNMSAAFFRDLALKAPDHSLQISQLPHNEMIGKMLLGIDPILEKEAPDWVVVYGDTNSTLAGALAATKRNIRLAHVEAGVRTHDSRMPEESNRFLTDRMATLNFCCTSTGIANLNREGIGTSPMTGRNYNAGDLMLDAAMRFGAHAVKQSVFLGSGPVEPFVLATIHRAENRNDLQSLTNIIDALNIIHKELRVICPLHPATRQKIEEGNLKTDFKILEPQGYLDMLALTQACTVLITDSGGLSREGYFFEKPTLILMKHPFWPEIIQNGNCMQSDSVCNEIMSNFHYLLNHPRIFLQGIFGDGHAAEKMAHELLG